MTSGARVLFAAATVVVSAAVVATIIVLGPPSQHRKVQLDSIRTGNLQTFQQLVVSFAKLHKRLPENLATLVNEPGYGPPPTDPESGASYAYERLSSDRFQVCATFDLPTDSRSLSDAQTWTHHAGKQCFELRVEIAPQGTP
jgi:hypothetical protein